MNDTTKPHSLGMHIMRHDLRVTDNEALLALSQQCKQVVVVFIFEPSHLQTNQFGHCHLGKHRHIFLDQGLSELKNTLHRLDIPMYLLSGKSTDVIKQLVQLNAIESISYENHYGPNEISDIAAIKKSVPACQFIEGNSQYLLQHNELTFAIDDMPDVFSPFRRKVEKTLAVREPIAKPVKNNASNTETVLNIGAIPIYQLGSLHTDNGYQGGEIAAQARIHDYFFATDGISTYKETRNGLDGWDFSSRLSAYLALGFVSPAYVYQQIKEYESKRGANDSTYWLFFELLWREFFHLQIKKQGILFFNFGGIQNKVPNTRHSDTVFTQWKQGKTPYPIVNAAMKQLAATGFMSNRSRQLVASCFVHELQLDWRYGAAYFEEMLIDFDVASNYGNWQYLAGVGSDPRGHRQFNLDKQTQIYDPNREFINKWQ